MSESNTIIGKNIKRLRFDRNCTSAELAEAIGVTQQAVSLWEAGKKTPRMGRIEKMAEYFGCYKSEILNDPDEKKIIPTPGYYEILDLEQLLDGQTRLIFHGRVLLSSEKAVIKNLADVYLRGGEPK